MKEYPRVILLLAADTFVDDLAAPRTVYPPIEKTKPDAEGEPEDRSKYT